MTAENQGIEQMVSHRHELHRLAEHSGEERETAARVTELLQECAPDGLITGLGGNGVAATFEGDREGPSVMLRCELDALPIPEENELSYGSKREGVAHKCGHDGHMAILLGVAARLAEHRPGKGKVHLLFQPSEETGQGARQILEDPQFGEVEPDYIFALHNLPGVAMNRVVIRDGIFASASRGYEVTLRGETSHAAHPENGRSPALALASLIQNFSSFPQYYTSLDEAAKVTVIHASLGEVAFGTSPGVAEFRATLRTYHNRVMNRLCERAEQMVNDIARTHGLRCETGWTERFRATRCHKECNLWIAEAAEKNGLEVDRRKKPFPWSEDFGRFTSDFPGAIFGLGAGEDHAPLHASTYDFPDELLPAGRDLFLRILENLTGPQL